MENPSWTYKGDIVESIPDEYEGFVYLITNKRRGYKESDWKEYWGSSDRLQADVDAQGPNNFTREILYLCKGRGEMSYLEAREQFERRVLERDDYYNGIINVRVGGSDKLKKALLEHTIQAKK
jgi:hypothetical protein